MSLATIIPIELVNHILSFRPRHPVAELIRQIKLNIDDIVFEFKDDCLDLTILEISALSRGLSSKYKNILGTYVFKNILSKNYYRYNKDKEYNPYYQQVKYGWTYKPNGFRKNINKNLYNDYKFIYENYYNQVFNIDEDAINLEEYYDGYNL
jgi:hypothetical protein